MRVPGRGLSQHTGAGTAGGFGRWMKRCGGMADGGGRLRARRGTRPQCSFLLTLSLLSRHFADKPREPKGALVSCINGLELEIAPAGAQPLATSGLLQGLVSDPRVRRASVARVSIGDEHRTAAEAERFLPPHLV